MVMATVTPVTVLAPPVLSRGHIVNVITVNVKRVMCIVEDMGNMDMVRKKLTSKSKKII